MYWEGGIRCNSQEWNFQKQTRDHKLGWRVISSLYRSTFSTITHTAFWKAQKHLRFLPSLLRKKTFPNPPKWQRNTCSLHYAPLQIRPHFKQRWKIVFHNQTITTHQLVGNQTPVLWSRSAWSANPPRFPAASLLFRVFCSCIIYKYTGDICGSLWHQSLPGSSLNNLLADCFHNVTPVSFSCFPFPDEIGGVFCSFLQRVVPNSKRKLTGIKSVCKEETCPRRACRRFLKSHLRWAWHCKLVREKTHIHKCCLMWRLFLCCSLIKAPPSSSNDSPKPQRLLANFASLLCSQSEKNHLYN